MPEFVVSKVGAALNARQRSVNGARVLVVGVAYKKNLDDTRESPALKIMDLLLHQGAKVVYHDPYVPVLRPSRHYDFNLSSVSLTSDELDRADVVVITTDHDCVDYEAIVESSRLIVDARNATRSVRNDRHKIVLA